MVRGREKKKRESSYGGWSMRVCIKHYACMRVCNKKKHISKKQRR